MTQFKFMPQKLLLSSSKCYDRNMQLDLTVIYFLNNISAPFIHLKEENKFTSNPSFAYFFPLQQKDLEKKI